MPAIRIGAVVVALLLLAAGCAGPGSGSQATHGAGLCLPPAVSAQFFFWPVVDFRSINLLTEEGNLSPASWVVYRRGKTAVAAMWVQSDLIAVDPDPETDAPEWVDFSLVMRVEDKLVLRRHPEASCRWQRWDNDPDASLARS
jgi:hypothetical protein